MDAYTRDMIALFASMDVRPECIDDALAACRAVREPSQKEAGCLRYDFYQSPDTPTNIVFFEEWESREILTAHFAEEHFKTFFAAVQPFMVAPPKIRVYDVSGHEDI